MIRTVWPEDAKVFLRNADVRALGLEPRGVSLTGVEGDIPSHMTRYVRGPEGRMVRQ